MLFHHTATEHKWTWCYKSSHMAQLTIANSNTQHYVKMLCTVATKPPSTSKFYVDFIIFFCKDQKIETHLSIFKCFAPCQVRLWAETLSFSAVLPLENTQTSSVAIFFTLMCFLRKAVDNIDLNQMSHRYVSEMTEMIPSTSAHLIDRSEDVVFEQERIKRTEKASPIYTLFHR